MSLRKLFTHRAVPVGFDERMHGQIVLHQEVVGAHPAIDDIDHEFAFAQDAVLVFELFGADDLGRIAVGGQVLGEQMMFAGLDGFKRLFEL